MDDHVVDLAALFKESEHLSSPQALELLDVDPQQMPECPVRKPPTVGLRPWADGQQQVDVGMKAQKLACRLHEAHATRLQRRLERDLEVQTPGPPRTAQQLA